LAGLFAQFESDGLTSFSLSHGCAVRRVAAGGDILDPDGDDITPSKLTVDCQIEDGEVASAAFDLELRTNRQDVFWSQRRLCPGSACPCFGATVFEASVQHLLFPAWSYSSVIDDESMSHW
jgi:hypothetical protein